VRIGVCRHVKVVDAPVVGEVALRAEAIAPVVHVARAQPAIGDSVAVVLPAAALISTPTKAW